MGDHAEEAWQQQLDMEVAGVDQDHYYDTLVYVNANGMPFRTQSFMRRKPWLHGNFNPDQDEQQPKFHRLVIDQLHGYTDKAVLVTGTITFDTPYHGMKEFHFLSDWLPRSQCLLTGNEARVPHWIVADRFRKRRARDAQFDHLVLNHLLDQRNCNK